MKNLKFAIFAVILLIMSVEIAHSELKTQYNPSVNLLLLKNSSICGNSIIEGKEECDDGNLTVDDGCDEHCAIADCWVCSGTPSSCQQTVCGDGIREGTEECDDGNNVDGDGCSSGCMIED